MGHHHEAAAAPSLLKPHPQLPQQRVRGLANLRAGRRRPRRARSRGVSAAAAAIGWAMGGGKGRAASLAFRPPSPRPAPVRRPRVRATMAENSWPPSQACGRWGGGGGGGVAAWR